jgi:hypothetical protein
MPASAIASAALISGWEVVFDDLWMNAIAFHAVEAMLFRAMLTP